MSKTNKTAQYFYTTCYIAMFLGSPNFWIEDFKCSKKVYKAYRILSKLLNIVISMFIIFELAAFFTQKNLTKKQETDLIIFSIAHPNFWSFSLIMFSREDNIKKLFAEIMSLKSLYNDEAVEEKMFQKSRRHSVALALSCILAVFSHTTSALIQFFMSDGTFTTVITAWPPVDDSSLPALAMRILNAIVWWMFVSRVIASHIIIIVLIIGISFQFCNLQSYFYNLDNIFHNDNLTQQEKEAEYETAFKLGVKLHTRTLQCVEKFCDIFQGIFNMEVVFTIILLVFLMTQMVKAERTMMNAAATAFTANSVLIGTGFFILNAGDITAESLKLPIAMSFSGWQHCRGQSSVRVKKLVIIAMNHAQKPVVIQALRFMDLSYESYVSLVKSSYSVFSVLY